jgi:hypothetical protein
MAFFVRARRAFLFVCGFVPALVISNFFFLCTQGSGSDSMSDSKRTRRDAEEAGLWVDGAKAAVAANPHPRDVVSDTVCA